jgi:hypothetical protein
MTPRARQAVAPADAQAEQGRAMYCTDLDLHQSEPRLASEAAGAAQTLLCCRATLEAGRLQLQRRVCVDALTVLPGQVVVIRHPSQDVAVYGILSVDAERCRVDVVPLGQSRRLASAPGSADVYAIFRTFALFRAAVADALHWKAGFDLDAPVPRLRNTERFRKPATLGALHLIYAGLNAACERENPDLQVRTEHYGRLYRRALRELTADAEPDADAIFGVRRDA